MAISASDLPERYQRQIMQKFMQQSQREQSAGVGREQAKKQGNKYHNKQSERITGTGGAIRFDSQKEARRYDELLTLLHAGEIEDLRMQVDFTLQEAYTDARGNRVRAIRYKADFTYKGKLGDRANQDALHWELVVEDVKSRATRTKDYVIKRKMMQDRLGIRIVEV